MKKYKDLCDYDFSDYAEEITGNALFKINGGAEVENSHEGVANAQVGDTITRNSGEVVVLKQADIDYAQQQLGTYGNSEQNNTSTGTQNYSGGSNQTTSETKEPIIQKKNDWTFNPNEPDSDKRYNAKDIGGLHVMTISCEDMNNIGDFANYYIMIGQYGTAGNTKYHGIALTDKNGDIIHILKDEGSIKRYTDYLASSTDKNINVMDVVGGVSTATGIVSSVADKMSRQPLSINNIEQIQKGAKTIGTISILTGIAATFNDSTIAIEKPTFKNLMRLGTDTFSFIPEYGPAISIVTNETTDLINDGINAGLDIYSPILQKEQMFDNVCKIYGEPSFMNVGGLSNVDVKTILFNEFKTFFGD